MPAPKLAITPQSKQIRAYYAALREFAAQDVSHEQAVRSAFQTLLADLARVLKWTAIPEQGKKVRTLGKKTRVVPDGTIKDKYQLPRGYWEAKDKADDLDSEIKDKIKKGYPLTNTIFWTPSRAVLYQSGAPVMRAEIAEANGQPAAFCDLLTAFLTHVEKPIVDFDEAVDTFVERVPAVGRKLAETVADAHKSNNKFKSAFAAFFDLCRTALNPSISQQAVDEMLVQHLLTKRLFRSVFRNPEFLQKNVIASEVERVIAALSSRHFDPDDFLKDLDHFYVAIENAAANVPDWSSKQHFLNNVYERFFQGYCVKTADTHGIVYTPQPIVDFMCESVEWVLETEFGKRLGDDGVNILDPCTGTGNFVVNLMRRAAERSPKALARMYREQLFANEIMLMPYYIAALNIEHEFFEQAGEYEAFEGLCFVDTLDLAEPKTMGLFTEANLARVDRQKKTPITVVIGNPPYNVGQENANDNNKNRPYPVIDSRIQSTYVASSSATNRSKLTDAYVRFIRWASDRLRDRDGLVCFVTNNGFLQGLGFDGFRKHLAREFAAVYHLNLKGNARTSGDRRQREGGNIFNDQIRAGVGISILLRRRDKKGNRILYHEVEDRATAEQKAAHLAACQSAGSTDWRELRADSNGDWFSPASTKTFRTLLPLASNAAKAGATTNPECVFKEFCIGVITSRDDVVYDFSRASLSDRVRQTVDDYNAEVARFHHGNQKSAVDEFVHYDKIKWSRDLKRDLERGKLAKYDKAKIIGSQYRPFARRWWFFDEILNQDTVRWATFSPRGEGRENSVIALTAVASEKPFMSLTVPGVCDFHLVGAASGTQSFPFYVYDDDGTNRRENITDWSLNLFRSHFAAVSPDAAARANKISKWDVFHYVYAILHHQGYRDTFVENLKRELPRIPLAKSYTDFAVFVSAGEKLAKLHLGYDDERVVKPYKLTEVWTLTDDEGRKHPKSWRVEEKMRLSKDKTSLLVNPTLRLDNIPPEVFRYRLGNRSALEWVIDQYEVYTDPKTDITSDANAWGEERGDNEYIVRLVKQVVTVSLETMKLVDALPEDYGGPPATSSGAPQVEDEPPASVSRVGGKFTLRSDAAGGQGRLRR